MPSGGWTSVAATERPPWPRRGSVRAASPPARPIVSAAPAGWDRRRPVVGSRRPTSTDAGPADHGPAATARFRAGCPTSWRTSPGDRGLAASWGLARRALRRALRRAFDGRFDEYLDRHLDRRLALGGHPTPWRHGPAWPGPPSGRPRQPPLRPLLPSPLRPGPKRLRPLPFAAAQPTVAATRLPRHARRAPRQRPRPWRRHRWRHPTQPRQRLPRPVRRPAARARHRQGRSSKPGARLPAGPSQLRPCRPIRPLRDR